MDIHKLEPGSRVGDAERDQCVAELQEHYGAGRLSTPEFEDRMSLALAAQTKTDIEDVLIDLRQPPLRRIVTKKRLTPVQVGGLAVVGLALAGTVIAGAIGLGISAAPVDAEQGAPYIQTAFCESYQREMDISEECPVGATPQFERIMVNSDRAQTSYDNIMTATEGQSYEGLPKVLAAADLALEQAKTARVEAERMLKAKNGEDLGTNDLRSQADAARKAATDLADLEVDVNDIMARENGPG